MGYLLFFGVTRGLMVFLQNLNLEDFFELAENKVIIVVDMKLLGWGVNGEAWKWRRRLFAWEEELTRDCVDMLSNIILQVEMEDR